MSTFQIGDIVVGNNSWLNSMLGYHGEVGVLIHIGLYSSVIRLFTLKQDITLLNEYIDKIKMEDKKDNLKIGDLVELKPKIRRILSINGVGTIIDETVIKTNDFDGKWTNDSINAFLVHFAEDDYEYTIPRSCLQIFSKPKSD